MRKQLLYLLLTVLLLFGGKATSQAATTLAAGDIAFIGLYTSGSGGVGDAFTFITLKALTEGTVIYFTDDGWNNGVWGGAASEVHFTWSPPAGGLPIGTIVTITGGAVQTVPGTPSIGTCSATFLSGTAWHYPTGEEILAYQSSTGARPASPTFIAGLTTYYNSTYYNAATKWCSSIPSGNTEQASTLPLNLENGVNCVSVKNATYNVSTTNCRYNGTLTGTASAVRALINSDANWTRVTTSPFDITSAAFPTPSITGSVAPTVTTQAVSSITATTATGNGNITDLGNPNPTQYGVCWNTGGTPTTSDSKTTQGATSSTGAFTSSITGLTANTTYYVRAYATNDAGTSYGDPAVSFTTLPLAPTVTSISPTSGPAAGGTTVTITGTNFTGATAVSFGGTAATGYTVNSATQITATSPAKSAGTIDITVTTAGGTSATSSSDQYTYIAAPTVTSISPTTGPTAGGTSVTITGTNFTGASAVKFGDVSAMYLVNSATSISASSPAGSAGVVDVTVITAGGTSAIGGSDQFTYVAAPTVTSISPTSGPTAGGTSVTITGTNLTGATAVSFGGSAATGVTVNSSTQVTATSPAGSVGTIHVTVTTPGGTSATGAGDQFDYYAAPAATTVAATSVTTTGAVLNGQINANNASTTVTFDYGTSVTYDHTDIAATPGTVTGTSTTDVSYTLTGLTPNTTYHFRVKGTSAGGTTDGSDLTFTTTAATTSTFQTDGNWSLATNWSAGIPGSGTEAVISANCSFDGNFATGNLIISANGALTIEASNTLTVTGDLDLESDNNGTGSLINNGTLSVTGAITVQRWMTAGAWHIVSSPLLGQSISNFLGTGNLTTIATNGTARGMMDYNPTGNSWNTYFTNATGGDIETGKGFSMRVGATATAVTFTGALQTGALSATNLTDGKWNCVGNPYTSAIGITTGSSASANFLTVNANNFAPSFGAIYVWNKPDASNGHTGNYTIISNTAPAFNEVQQGQAFMVNMKTGVTSLSFTSAMQIHAPALELKSAKVAWPVIKLKATVGQQVSSTIVAFNSGMTKGLDPTYDAGLLKGASDLIVYSKLVEDNGIPFAVQALPDNDYSNMIVPIGLDFKIGGEVVFSAEMSNLSPDCMVILEDKLTKTFTDLAKDVYKVTIAAKSVISDRFNLHTSYQTTGTSPLLPTSAFNLKAYPVNGEIVIEGEVGNQAKAILFDVNGRKLGQYPLKGTNRNTITAAGLVPGVYLLNVMQAEKRFNTKIVIY